MLYPNLLLKTSTKIRLPRPAISICHQATFVLGIMPVNIRKLLLFLLLLLPACAGQNGQNSASRYALDEPLRLKILNRQEAGELAQGLSAGAFGLRSWQELDFALRQSLAYVSLRPAEETALELPSDPPLLLRWGDLRAGQLRMLEILPYLDINPGLLAHEFTWVSLEREFGFTGYYEPALKADYRRSPAYPYPLYGLPPELSFLPAGERYHDRRAIDRDGVLAGRNLEIAWAADDVDIFFLQIQGSGRLFFPDGREKHALYAGKNGQPYVPLGRELARLGLLEQDKISMRGIREALRSNPERKEELLDLNPSYVFFRLENEGPVGGMGRILTPRVSLAADPAVLPYGALIFFQTDMPDAQGEHLLSLSALGLPQDKGGAIRGRRIDIFLGAGSEAAHLAGHLNSAGRVCLLLPAPVQPPEIQEPQERVTLESASLDDRETKGDGN